MEAISTPETSVSIYQTARRNIPEDSHLHTRRRENLKSHNLFHLLFFYRILEYFSFKFKTKEQNYLLSDIRS
jgi:hypothetical protein